MAWMVIRGREMGDKVQKIWIPQNIVLAQWPGVFLNGSFCFTNTGIPDALNKANT
jgi:hypothetical protein